MEQAQMQGWKGATEQQYWAGKQAATAAARSPVRWAWRQAVQQAGTVLAAD